MGEHTEPVILDLMGALRASTEAAQGRAAPTPEREAFLAERRRGIGGSDAPAIVGADPRVTRYQLWREKRGLPDERTGKPAAARRGNYLEPAILRRYAETMKPAKLEVGIPHATGDGGWRRGNQDARATMSDGRRVAVEAKSVNRFVFRADHDPKQVWGTPYTDEVPERHLCQGLWYGALDNADCVDFAVLVIPDDPDEVLGRTADEVAAMSEFHVYRAPRHRGIERWLVEQAETFWFENVLAGVAPDLANEDDVDLRWPHEIAGKAMPAEPVLALLREYAEVTDRWNADKKRREHLRERLLIYADGAEALVAPDGRTPWLTMTVEERAAHAVKASTSRVLRTTKWWKRAHPPTTPTPENET
jgi:hypothetical protein